MTDTTPAEIETLGTRLVYENRWLKVREDTIRRQDGSVGIYGVVDKPDFVMIVPVGEDGSFHMVEQYRYPVGGRYWEFPQGSREGAPDADPLDVARSELREETGLDASEMIYAGHLFEAYGISNQGCHLFVARGLRQGETALEPEELGLISRAVMPTEFKQMICNGQIKDACTIAAMQLLQFKGLVTL